MRWSLISADGVKLPFHQRGNRVSFKWKSSWNLFIPKFAANIPEEMLPSKRQWDWERGPISDVIVTRYSRNFPHPHLCQHPAFQFWQMREKMEAFQLMFWIEFHGLVTIQEDARPLTPLPWHYSGRLSNGAERQVACSPTLLPQAGVPLLWAACVPRQCGS